MIVTIKTRTEPIKIIKNQNSTNDKNNDYDYDNNQ